MWDVLVGGGSRAGRPRPHGVESVDVRELFLLGLVQSAIDQVHPASGGVSVVRVQELQRRPDSYHMVARAHSDRVH